MSKISLRKRLLVLSIIVMMAVVACTGDDGDSETTENVNEVIAEATPVPDPTPTTQEVIDAQQDEQTQATTEEETVNNSAETTTTDTISETTTQQDMVEEAPAYNGPDWTQIELTNAITGETFTFADFAGQAVFVHPMATWCSNCRMSQNNIRDNVIPQLNTDEYAFISLSVETGLATSNLARYAADNGFNWTFAVLSPDALAALVRAFGPTISNPPTQPHFIIGPDGTPSRLMTGSDSAADIIADLNATLGS